MIKKTLIKRSGPKRSAKNFLMFRLAAFVVLLGVFAVFGLLGKNTLAQSWSEPPNGSIPPANNVSGPVWTQNSLVQTGNFWLSGKGRLDASGTGDATCQGAKVCLADSTGGYGLVSEMTSGTGGAGPAVYAQGNAGFGIYASSTSNYAGDFVGNVYVTGTLNAATALQVNGTNVCLADGTHCQGSGGYWTATGNDIYNNNTGKVGIGTTTPQFKLTLNGAGTWLTAGSSTISLSESGVRQWVLASGGIVSGDFSIINGSDSLAKLSIQGSTGFVGIGTTTPQQSLHVSSATAYQGIFINGSAAPSIGFAQNLTTTSAWKLGLQGTNGTRLAISSGAGNTNVMSFAGSNVGIGYDDPGTAMLAINGNVGIGTTAPGAPLTITPVTDFQNKILWYDDGANYIGGITKQSGDMGAIFTKGANANFKIKVSPTYAGALVDAFTINTNGKVGIGTTSPGELLSVGAAGTTKGVLSLAGDTSGKVIIQPQAAAGSATYTLPPNAPGTAGYVLSSDTSGNLTWAAPSGGGSQTPWTANEVAAGYTLYGNSTVSGNMTIDSTSNATKGYTIINPTTGNVGIGTTTPTNGKLDVETALATTPAIYGLTSTAGDISIIGKNTATSGNSTAIEGVTSDASGYGVYGTNLGSGVAIYGNGGTTGVQGSGLGQGVYGSATNSTGVGVQGSAISATGVNYGVEGTSPSTSGYGVAGTATATSGTTYGVYGISMSGSGYGVYATNTATSGVTYGVFANVASSSGYAIYAQSTATSGNASGIYASAANPLGVAVEGEATSATGINYGVYGDTGSPTGFGVAGKGGSTTGNSVGVYGMTMSTTGYGVYGVTANTGSGSGVYGVGKGTTGTGVWGQEISSTGVNYGVYGSTGSPAGYGVYGTNTATTSGATGVYGTSASGSGYGVYGNNSGTLGVGIYGVGQFNGVNGAATVATGYGVYGQNSASTGTSAGVYGISFGTTIGAGVYGVNGSTAGGYGVQGVNSGTSGVGVYGQELAASGTTYGVYGSVASPNGDGVYATCTGTGGTCNGLEAHATNGASAVFAVGGAYGVFASGTAYGFYTTGNTYIGGNLNMSGTSSISTGTLSNSGGYFSTLYSSQSFPTTTVSGGLKIAYNKTNGGAETDFYDLFPGATTGFNFYTGTGTNTFALSASISSNGTYTPSDRRLKTDIKTMDNDHGLSIIEKLDPVTFRWKYDPAGVGEQLGLIAQEVQTVLPQVVKGKTDGDPLSDPLTINYSAITPELIKAVQQQQKEIDDLKLQIAELKAK